MKEIKETNSPIKSTQSRNFSSVATIENSTSPKSSPKRELYILNKNKLDPKFSNELIFDNQTKSNNKIYQSLNIKPKNNSIYLTGIGNVNDIKSEIIPSDSSRLIEFPNLGKKNSKINIKNKISLDSLPYILTSSNHKHNQMSPVFTCCDQELSPKILNKFLHQQEEKESKYKQCKTVENAKKIIYSKSPEKRIRPIGSKDYIDKTREINRIKYCMNLRTEGIKEFNYNIKEQINSIDYTINSLKIYKTNLENNFLNEFIVQLRALNQAALKERLEEEKLRNTLVKLKKENYNLLAKIRKNEINNFYLEKWLSLLIYIKDKVKINEKKIPNYISKNYKGKLIIETPEEFDDFYKKKEQKNIILIETLNHSNEEKMALFKEFKKIKQTFSEDKNLIISILEKEKLLSLLKMRNNELLNEKKEIIRSQSKFGNSEDTSFKSLTPSNLLKNNKNNKEKNHINFNLIFNLIQKTFDYIYINDKESVHDSEESLPVINNIMVKSTKALSQMKIIELCYTSLFYYKESHLQGHETLYKRLMEEIDLSHKKAKSEKYKKEEELRALELYKKLQAKRNKIVFKPTHLDNYSSLVYIEKLKKEAKKKTKKTKKDIDIFDFLYDMDDNDDEEIKK